jgi:hypothetical protein
MKEYASANQVSPEVIDDFLAIQNAKARGELRG